MTREDIFQAAGMAATFRIIAENYLENFPLGSPETYRADQLNRAAATIEKLLAHIEHLDPQP